MKELTDQELTDKISQVFENFEDPNAAQGWQELRKKYPENSIRSTIFWWGAAAAVLLVVGSLWLFIPDTIEGTGEIADATSANQKEKLDIEKRSKNILNKKEQQPSPTTNPIDGTIHGKEADTSNHTYHESEIELRSSLSHKFAISASGKPTKDEQTFTQIAVNIPTTSIQKNTDEVLPISSPDLAKPSSTITVLSSKRDSMIEVKATMLALTRQNPAQDDHHHIVEKIPYALKKTNTKKSVLSFYAGSYFNYSLGSKTELNFGAGFTSDIKLTSNLKLSTGLALANNSLQYNDGAPSTSKKNLAFGSANTGTSNNNLTTITRVDAKLLALDIPINLKYLIIPKDNKLYFLAGLSSGTFLAENYTLNYGNYSAVGVFVNQPQAVEVNKQFQTFDLARTLNISFGYSSNVGKTQNITIEPFLKYPLGGLGSEDLKFGSAGVNLKLNFSNFIKR